MGQIEKIVALNTPVPGVMPNNYYHYFVDLDLLFWRDNHLQILEWCSHNLNNHIDGWHALVNRYFFSNKEDYLLFVLRWA